MKIFDGISKFLGQVVAESRIEKENQKRIATEQIRRNKLQRIYFDYYPTIMELLSEAIGNASENTGLIVPRSSEFLAVRKNAVQIQKNGLIVFLFRANRRNERKTAIQMSRILEYEINEIAYMRNVPALTVRAEFRDNYQVFIRMAFVDQVRILSGRN